MLAEMPEFPGKQGLISKASRSVGKSFSAHKKKAKGKKKKRKKRA